MRRNVWRTPRRVEVSRETSLADTKIGENHIQQILNIGLSRDPAHAAPRQSQILRAQFRQASLERAAQCLACAFQRLAMARAGEKRGGDVIAGGNAPAERAGQYRDSC